MNCTSPATLPQASVLPDDTETSHPARMYCFVPEAMFVSPAGSDIPSAVINVPIPMAGESGVRMSLAV